MPAPVCFKVENHPSAGIQDGDWEKRLLAPIHGNHLALLPHSKRWMLLQILTMGVILLGFANAASAWVNPNFTAGLTGWTTSFSTTGGWTAVTCTAPSATVVNATTSSAAGLGVAPNTDGLLPDHPACSPNAVQLYSSRGDDNHLDWARIEQTDTVPTNGNTCLTFWFAGVFESHHYDLGQTANQSDSYLQVDVLVGGTPVATLLYSWETNLTYIVQLTNTQVAAAGDGTYCAVNGNPNRWGYLPWKEYAINLCAYAGQQATLRVTDYDCDAGGHYGFGYLSCVNWSSCPPPAMTLAKVNSPTGQVAQGTTITYTLTYQNAGEGGADGVTITDAIPANTTLVSNSISSNPSIFDTRQVGNNIIWDVGYVAPGASGNLTFKVVASQSCVTIINTAAETDLLKPCTSPGLQSNAVTNTVGGCTPTPTITSTPTVTRTFTLSPTPSSTFTASFTATSTWSATSTSTNTKTATPTNTSTATSTSTNSFTSTHTAAITNTYTPSYTSTSSFTSTATHTAVATSTTTVTAIFTSTSTNSFTVTDTFTAAHTATDTSNATVTPTATWTYTPTNTRTPTSTFTATNTATVISTATQTPTITITYTPTSTSTVQVSFVKKVSSNLAQSGDLLTYSLNLTVMGNQASGVVVTDSLPAHVTYVGPGSNSPSSLPGPVFNATLDQLTWTLPALESGTYQLSYQTRVDNLLLGGTQLINRAVLFSSNSGPMTSIAPVVVVGAYTVKIGVYNEAGELIAQIYTAQLSQALQAISLGTNNTVSSLNGAVTVYFAGTPIAVWNGTNSVGNPVTNGVYHVKADSFDAAGVDQTTTLQTTVSRSLAKLEVDIYNEAGEIVKHLYATVVDSDGAGMAKMTILSPVMDAVVGVGQNQIVIFPMNGAPTTLVWDGTSDSGNYLTAGKYMVEAHWNGAQGGEQTIVQGLIMTSSRPSTGRVTVKPNLLRVSQGDTRAVFQIDSPDSNTLGVKLYDLAGELVQSADGGTGSSGVTLDCSALSTGIYIAVVEVKGPNDRVSRQTLKVAVVR